MPRGGRIGPPHITRSRESFNALDMFKKLIEASTGPVDGRISAAGDFRISASGDFRVWQ